MYTKLTSDSHHTVTREPSFENIKNLDFSRKYFCTHACGWVGVSVTVLYFFSFLENIVLFEEKYCMDKFQHYIYVRGFLKHFTRLAHMFLPRSKKNKHLDPMFILRDVQFRVSHSLVVPLFPSF
jgi:hypothetical protein